MNLPNRGLKLLLAFLVILKNTYAQRLKRLNHLLPQHSQRLRCVRSDKYTFPLRQQMAEKIRDSVGLARTGRALYENAVFTFELTCNPELFSICRFAEKYLCVFVSKAQSGFYGFDGRFRLLWQCESKNLQK